MPGNKKTRKPYRPKMLSSSAVARALTPAVPMDWDKQMGIVLAAHQSIEALRTGAGTESDFGVLAVAMNLSLMLCEIGIGTEWQALVPAAQDALVRCEARSKKAGKWGFDGPGLVAVREALDLHDEQMTVATQKQIRAGIERARQRELEGNIMEAV